MGAWLRGTFSATLVASALAVAGAATAQSAKAPGTAPEAAPARDTVSGSWSVAAVATAPSPGAATASSPGAGPERRRSRGWVYIHDLVGPGAIAGVAAAATMDQLREDPPDWGTGGSGFGRRAASRAGQLVVQESVRHGIAALMGRSTEYQRCACTDFGGRFANAFVETFTDRDASGKRGFSVARVAGAYSGAFAPRLWRPGVTTAGAIGEGTGGLLVTAAVNLLSEYVHWPH